MVRMVIDHISLQAHFTLRYRGQHLLWNLLHCLPQHIFDDGRVHPTLLFIHTASEKQFNLHLLLGVVLQLHPKVLQPNHLRLKVLQPNLLLRKLRPTSNLGVCL